MGSVGRNGAGKKSNGKAQGIAIGKPDFLAHMGQPNLTPAEPA